jgi:hypothetical protein
LLTHNLDLKQDFSLEIFSSAVLTLKYYIINFLLNVIHSNSNVVESGDRLDYLVSPTFKTFYNFHLKKNLSK